MKLTDINWPTAIATIVVVLAVGAAYLFGPSLGVSEEGQAQLLAGIGAVGGVVLAALNSLFGGKKESKGGAS
tara:strand:+ start:2302 stop:2517 length:216 start_codon:yes stop_codon:yes gene_type:complete